MTSVPPGGAASGGGGVAPAGAGAAGTSGVAGAQAQAGMAGSAGGDPVAGAPASGSGGVAGDSAGGTGGTGATGGEMVSPDDPGIAPTAVTGLTIEENPNNVLSAYVSWTTDQAATSEVQFGEGEYQFEIVHDELVTDHRVLVIGMHAQTTYSIKALSGNSAGTAEAEGEFATGALPSEVPIPELTENDAASSQSGWTLTNIMVGTGGGFGSQFPAVAVIYDELGVPVWYYVNGDSADSRGDISVDLLENQDVLIGPAPGEPAREVDLGGNVVWEGPQNGGQEFMHHHAGQLTNGDYVVIRDSPSGGIAGARIDEFTPDNQVVWSWDLLEHVTPPGSASGDWCHGNSVTVDLDQDIFYFNCRFLGLFKVQRSGEIIWHMGGTLNSDVPSDLTYPISGSQFSDAHDPEIHDDGTILLHDNGGYAGVGGNPGYHSRVLEYAIDETNMTATLVWEFPGDFPVDSWYTDEWYGAYWGDADRLENNNVLITAGLKASDLQTRIFEVTREGSVVWEITMPANQGSYRAQRLSPPPLVRPIP